MRCLLWLAPWLTVPCTWSATRGQASRFRCNMIKLIHTSRLFRCRGKSILTILPSPVSAQETWGFKVSGYGTHWTWRSHHCYNRSRVFPRQVNRTQCHVSTSMTCITRRAPKLSAIPCVTPYSGRNKDGHNIRTLLEGVRETNTSLARGLERIVLCRRFRKAVETSENWNGIDSSMECPKTICLWMQPFRLQKHSPWKQYWALIHMTVIELSDVSWGFEGL